MKSSNVRIISNVYPVQSEIRENLDGTNDEIISKEGNEAYFQQISDLNAFKTACDSCGDMDPRHVEKPWGRIRINDKLVNKCKCTKTSCHLYYIECRPECKE